MSNEAESSEKSFEPTPKRLEEVRRKGEVPKSNEVTTALVYGAFALVMVAVGQDGLSAFATALVNLIANADQIAAADGVSGPKLFAELMGETGVVVIAILLVPTLGAIVSLLGQRAFVFAPTKLEPKLSKISIVKGLKNKFGANGLFEFGKSTFKLAVVSLAAVWLVLSSLGSLLTSVKLDERALSLQIGSFVIQLVLLGFAINFVLGIADYFWQYTQHIKKNMMTRQEVQDETKDSEGDPHLKQARRNRAIDIATNHMLADVPTADVIIVNPTHYAVALRWDRSTANAPICIAKGVDEVAARIRNAGSAAKIPVFSDPPTARALFAVVDLRQAIQSDHYKAVAVAIRFAEKVRKKRAATP